MTVANGTIDGILDAASRSGTAVLMYCQTGSAFGDILLEHGAAAAVCEPHPFYLSSEGPSSLRVHRADRAP
jgi:hypothetical protein